MATLKQRKYAALPKSLQGNDITFQKQYWIDRAEYLGYVWNDSERVWTITVDNITYRTDNSNISNEQWADPWRQLGDRNYMNDEYAVKIQTNFENTQKTTILTDENGNYYYIDALGRKNYTSGFATSATNVNSQFDLGTDVVLDALGNEIKVEYFASGQFNPVNQLYIERVYKKKSLYRNYYQTKNVALMQQRAKDIIVERDELIAELEKIGIRISKTKLRDTIFLSAITVTTAGAGIALGGLAALGSVATKAIPAFSGVVKFGSSSTIKNLAGLAQYQYNRAELLQKELEALPEFVQSKSNDAGSNNAITPAKIALMIGILAIAGLIIYRIIKKR